LTAAGWQPWKAPMCPEEKVDGFYSCWRRDELTLDLWVRKPTCTALTPASPQPSEPNKPRPGASGPPAEDCAGSQVSLKVRNAIDDVRTRPQPSPTPSY
jgi:hypothetical protein